MDKFVVGEWPQIVAAIDALRSAPAPVGLAGAARRTTLAAASSVVLLAFLALASCWPQGAEADHALLRLGWRLAGQVKEQCRDLTPEELAKRPVHMRTPRECVSEVLPYELTAVVNGRVVSAKRVASPGLRADRPLSVEEDLVVPPGEHAISVTFVPVDAAGGGVRLSFERTLRFERGRVILLTAEDDRLTVR